VLLLLFERVVGRRSAVGSETGTLDRTVVPVRRRMGRLAEALGTPKVLSETAISVIKQKNSVLMDFFNNMPPNQSFFMYNKYSNQLFELLKGENERCQTITQQQLWSL
jgi:hypothetical protein